MPLETVEPKQEKDAIRPAYRPMNEVDRARMIALLLWVGMAVAAFAFLIYLVVHPW